MRTLLRRLVREDKGQDIIEYALLAAGISIVTVPVVPLIGETLNNVYSNLNDEVGKLPGA